MDSSLEEFWSELQLKSGNQETASDTATPDAMRHQAYVLAAEGLRREAADMLRSAVNLAEELEAEPKQQIPLLEALAEVLWQMGDKQEARIRANRAIEMWFRARPSEAFDNAVSNADPAASTAA